MDYSNKTYQELQKEEDRLEEKYNEISDECAKEGLSYSEFCNKSHDIKEQLYFISKYKRLKKDATIKYDAEYNGDLMTIEKFKSMCENGEFIDEDGYGRYATTNSVSDVEIYPSDVLENLVRTDFTHVIWFNI